MAHDEELPGPGDDDVNGESSGGSSGASSGASNDAEGAAENTAENSAENSAERGGDPEDFTVDDILAAEQTAEASEADAASGAEAGDAEAGDPEAGAVSEAESHLEDLRRLSAEYANYRKRTEANAALEKQRATAAAVAALLPVVDDLDRAEQHGDLVEGSAFATIAQKIRGVLERMGLEGFGEKGEPFDPQVHEAVAQVPVPGTEEPAVLDVIERGYRIGDVELRPAKVAVAVGADG